MLIVCLALGWVTGLAITIACVAMFDPGFLGALGIFSSTGSVVTVLVAAALAYLTKPPEHQRVSATHANTVTP